MGHIYRERRDKIKRRHRENKESRIERGTERHSDKLDVVVPSCNPSMLEAEAGCRGVGGKLILHRKTVKQTNKKGAEGEG